MKTRKNLLIEFAVLALVLFMAGCASSQTSESTGQYVDDSVITAKVKAALLNANNLPSTQIDVKTYKGVVELSGFVDSQEVEQRAIQIARDVDDVKDVEDHMTVRSNVGGGNGGS